ncbi:MAG: 4Fe-4S ferredoxin [Desulfobulbaceae bacterium]|nr:4Fe-4S ferredoxin [Desulfobulbaceae bacterium]
MKIMRKIIEIDDALCNGCGECVPNCAEGALVIVDGKARMIAEKYCDGLGACLGHCPTGALKVIEREADDFDEAAVEELLASQKKMKGEVIEPALGCGCASSHMEIFAPATPCRTANKPVGGLPAAAGSALSHWPIQIRLVPPSAPFLKKADLLVAADCTPAAYANFHQDLLAGKVVMMGCPKFDDAESYVQKFAEILKTAGLNSLTIAIMEVPCCGSMRGIVKEAMKRSGVTVKTEEVVISTRGEVVRRGPLGL